ncbi:hypothetical protein S7711_10979 [Stachybotrys chartarum IBT 7711]|uniref:Uncharacterized protein n=1 Tax=Stachybotrys chartarum (strain CBS 109288 / IBT 7711) TaxID=1280523 RepID=A0A084ATF1_STACB|nr:hypothetical protein S7711_10979 [Stachybotrys chartarum IBT 7711]
MAEEELSQFLMESPISVELGGTMQKIDCIPNPSSSPRAPPVRQPRPGAVHFRDGKEAANYLVGANRELMARVLANQACPPLPPNPYRILSEATPRTEVASPRAPEHRIVLSGQGRSIVLVVGMFIVSDQWDGLNPETVCGRKSNKLFAKPLRRLAFLCHDGTKFGYIQTPDYLVCCEFGPVAYQDSHRTIKMLSVQRYAVGPGLVTSRLALLWLTALAFASVQEAL